MRRFALIAGLALLAGCHHPGSPEAALRASAGALAMSEPDLDQPLKLNPDQALEKATKKAQEWQPDVRLVSVGWGVAKFQTTSLTWHTFYSKKANKLLVVESRLTSWIQKTRELSGLKFTVPARLAGTVGPTKVSGPEALAIAKQHLPPDQQRPVAALVLIKPNRFAPPVWMVRADDLKCVIHAESGKVLAKTDYDIPYLPFVESEPERTGL